MAITVCRHPGLMNWGASAATGLAFVAECRAAQLALIPVTVYSAARPPLKVAVW